MKPVATYVMSNTTALLIFEVNSDAVLVGTSEDDGEWAEWCEIDHVLTEDDDNETEIIFRWGEIEVPLSQCMRVNM